MRKAPRRRPSLESLEERRLPAIFGLPWPDPVHLTLSFAPDGAVVGDAPSTLNQTLGSTLPSAVWKADILRAFQSWAAFGNINIGLVSDNGQAAGQPGPLQSNPGTGDIRISARPLSSNVLAEAVPFDLLDSWSGTVVLNSNATFGDGPNASEDLFTAALHEAGHVLGLPDNETDPTSAMYDENSPVRTGPNAADVAALQALYGARSDSPDEGRQGNDSIATATPIAFLAPGSPLGWFPNWFQGPVAVPTVVNGDIGTLSDKEVYEFNTPLTGGAFAVAVRTSGISLLAARLDVYDPLGQLVASATATDPLHGDLMVTIPSSVPGATYHAQVSSARSDAFGIGAYRLAVGAPDLAAAAVNASSSTSTVPGESVNQPADLDPSTTTDARWPYVVTGSLNGSNDANYFRISTSKTAPGALIVSAWGLQSGGLSPSLTVFDARRNPVAVQILAQDASSVTVQLLAASADTKYTIEVSAADPAHASGGYELGATFRTSPITLSSFAAGALGSSQTQDFRTLQVNQSGLFRFDVSALAGSGSPAGDIAVRMTVYDAQNRPVFSIRSVANAASGAGDVLLAPGKYHIRIVAGTRTGSPLPTISYALRGMLRSDPIDPSPSDPTLAPAGPNQSAPPTDPYSTTQDPMDTYLGLVALGDPYSNPWPY